VNKKRDGLLAWCLFALLFSIYLLTFSGRYHSSDEMSMLVATDSLARRGQWDIDLLRWMGEQQGSFGPDGHLYSRKGIGTTLVALPLYWLAVQWQKLGNVQTAMLTNGVVTALTGVLVLLFLRRLRYSAGVALGTALGFGLGTMAWPYARYLFSESLAGLGLMLSAYFLLRYRDERDPVSLLLAGSGLAIALLSRLNNAIVAPFLGLLLLAYVAQPRPQNWRAWITPFVLFGLPVLASLAVTGWYNSLRFGDVLNTGYLPQERFSTPFFEGLYGLTFSPGKGLFWYNPLFFAAVAAWPAFFRRHRPEALLAATVVIAGIAFYAPWYLWWAGHSWGPRFLVTILPFAALSLAPALEAAFHRRTLAAGLATLAGLSVTVQLLAVAVNFNLYLEEVYARLGLYHPATLFNPAYSPLLRQVAYIRPENLDLAWIRGGAVDSIALLVGILCVLLSGLALWAAWRSRLPLVIGRGLAALLILACGFLLVRYAPQGDPADAARALNAMERPGEAVALAQPLLTEAFQDAYDGRLPVWGVPSQEDVGGEHRAVWIAGARGSDPAQARFQIGAVRLDFCYVGEEPATQPFDVGRLPVSPLPKEMRLGDTVALVGVQVGETTVRQGDVLPVTLYWRALAPMRTSYTAFVQVIGENDVKAGQIDRPPCDGDCPTLAWRPGNLIGERYDVLIRPDAPAGRYELIGGMYDLQTGEQLPALDAQGNPVGTCLSLATVEVQP
jgi:hypothetical protein